MHEEKGFSLVDVLIAIVILTVGLLSLATLQTTAIRINSSAGKISSGVTVAQERMEELLAISDDSHADLTLGSHTDGDPPAGFSVTWNVAEYLPVDWNGDGISGTRQIEVTVTWYDRGEVKTSRLSSVKYLN